jgi:hypothetical protein
MTIEINGFLEIFNIIISSLIATLQIQILNYIKPQAIINNPLVTINIRGFVNRAVDKK